MCDEHHIDSPEAVCRPAAARVAAQEGQSAAQPCEKQKPTMSISMISGSEGLATDLSSRHTDGLVFMFQDLSRDFVLASLTLET